MKIGHFFARCAGKFIIFAMRLLGRGAGNLPGEIILKLCPGILSSFQIDCPIIAVTGTNGKTTTNNIIGDMFKRTGKKVISNNLGNNINSGIVTLLLDKCSLSGKIDADYLVLEVDESYIPVVFKTLKLETLVLLNFFRDQLDRNGEVETLVLKIKSFLETFEGNVVLNNDDPNVSRLGLANPDNKNIYYYSLDRYAYATDTMHEPGEGKFCPICGTRLKYDYYQYSHTGKFRCPKCGFGDNPIFAQIKNIDVEKGSFTADGEDYTVRFNSIYYMYNVAAVYALGKLYSVKPSVMKDTFSQFVLNNGRLEEVEIRGSKALINLAKNPTGANVTIRMFNETPGEKELLFVLNDNVPDGLDVSWIWDVDFSRLNGITRVVTSGKRAYDIAIRIKCSDYPAEKIEVYPDLDEAVEHLFATTGKKYVIANYTAIQPTRHAILRFKEKCEKEDA